MQYKVLKRFMDGPFFYGDKSIMREVGDVIDVIGMRLMRLSAYGIVMLGGSGQGENAMSNNGEKRGRGRPRK